MFSVEEFPLPENALLGRYLGDGNYTDCFRIEFPAAISHAEYVEAFYTTPLFKLERTILKWAVSKPSSDADAHRLAAGDTDSFAAWSVEAREDNQILLCDYLQRTRSWLMTVPLIEGEHPKTQLYFGSAVVAPSNVNGQEDSLGRFFQLSRGFHQVYSAALLRAATENIKCRTGIR